MEDRRRQAAEKAAAARRATEKEILEDADHLVAVWNERQAKRMPMLFSPTIGAAITAGYWFLRARCPACRKSGQRSALVGIDFCRTQTCRLAGLLSPSCGTLLREIAVKVAAIPSLPCSPSVQSRDWVSDSRPGLVASGSRPCRRQYCSGVVKGSNAFGVSGGCDAEKRARFGDICGYSRVWRYCRERPSSRCPDL